MKKKSIFSLSDIWQEIKKLLLTMKLMAIILTITVFQAVGSVYSQNTTFNFHLKNVTVKTVLQTIEENSEFKFLYRNELLDVSRKVDVTAKNDRVETILQSIFNSPDISYRVFEDNLIVITNHRMLQIQRQISGTVTNASDGSPIPGVNIVFKGTTVGTISDINGNYRLEVPSDANILVFSFIGMKVQEIDISNLTTVNVVMEEDAVGLEEVVAIGYGSQSRVLSTSSLSRVTNEQLKDKAVVTFSEAMVAQMPGVQIIQTDGAPGAPLVIRIRGVGSITSGDKPLYVIDGQPIDHVQDQRTFYWGGGADPLAGINPNDIASIDILKDASATAIYGSRGSNGVVLITTKQGGIGKPPRFEFNISTGIQSLSKKVDMMNRDEAVQQQIDFRNQQRRNSGGNVDDPNSVRALGQKIPNEWRNPGSLPDIDYQDIMFENAPLQNAQLSVQGGTSSVRYYLSGDASQQDGILINTGIKRLSMRTNVDADVSSRVKLGFRINPSFTFTNENQTGGWGGLMSHGILSIPPWFEFYNEDGSYNWQGPTWTYDDGTAPTINYFTNAAAQILEQRKGQQQFRLLSNAYLSAEIASHLTFRTSVAGDIANRRYNEFNPSTAFRVVGATTVTGRLFHASNMGWVNENTLTYANTFMDRHSIDIIVGGTAEKYYYESSNMTANQFPNDRVTTLNAGTVNSGTQSKSERSLLSVLARVMYDYDKKYLFTATYRRDGSSRFGTENRWGTFPSLSVGWRIAQESFMQNIPVISELKVRASWGLSGNDNIPNYGSVGGVGSANYIFGAGAGIAMNGLVQSSISNRNLGWEQTETINAGFDIGLFSNRIYLAVDRYNSLTSDLLLDVPIPTMNGFSSSLQNIGQVRNKGLEFLLETNNISKRDLTWNTSFNISFNRNIVESLGQGDADIITSVSSDNWLTHITTVGKPIGSFFGYTHMGVYRTQAERDADPVIYGISPHGPGDVRIKDVSGPDGVPDGRIDIHDRAYIGHPDPDFIYGMTNTLKYKGVDFSFTLQGVQGATTMNGMFRNLYRWYSGQNRNYWRSEEEPGDGRTFRLGGHATNQHPSTFWLEDATFLRIKSVILGYTVPSRILGNRISNLRIYVNAQNLFTFTSYPLYNPEQNTFQGDSYANLVRGMEWGGYPLARTFNFGLNLTF